MGHPIHLPESPQRSGPGQRPLGVHSSKPQRPSHSPRHISTDVKQLLPLPYFKDKGSLWSQDGLESMAILLLASQVLGL